MPLTNHDFIAANRAYFDENAQTYDGKSHSLELAKRSVSQLSEARTDREQNSPSDTRNLRF